jgi:hypothetical protein
MRARLAKPGDGGGLDRVEKFGREQWRLAALDDVLRSSRATPRGTSARQCRVQGKQRSQRLVDRTRVGEMRCQLGLEDAQQRRGFRVRVSSARDHSARAG